MYVYVQITYARQPHRPSRSTQFHLKESLLCKKSMGKQEKDKKVLCENKDECMGVNATLIVLCSR